MRTVDERVAAVHSRTRRLRRKRNDRMLGALACLIALPLVVLTGGYVAGTFELSQAQDEGMFGAASLLGSSAGGYVLVAVVSFSLAVLATVFIMLRRRRHDEEKQAPDSAAERESDKPSSKTTQ